MDVSLDHWEGLLLLWIALSIFLDIFSPSKGGVKCRDY